ncbi:MAG: hypothetical protein ACOX8U_09015, partial [Bradymonadia bacterium]
MAFTEHGMRIKQLFFITAIGFALSIASCAWDENLGTYTGDRCPPKDKVNANVLSNSADYNKNVQRCAEHLKCVPIKGQNNAFECKSGGGCDEGICQLTAPTCENTPIACGTACKNCTENALPNTAVCELGRCIAKACNKYYHPEEKDNNVVCVANTHVSCAPPTTELVESPANCTTLPNVESSYCGEEGYCVITECNDGYHIVKGQNSDDSCAPNSGFAC